MLYDLFNNIANWDYTEVKPAPYGWFHILFSVLGIALCVFLALKLKNIGERGNRAVLLTVGLFLLITEVYKQLFYYCAMGDTPYYHWWIFPFQLCSVPMYLCIVCAIIPDGIVRRGMYNFMYTFNLLGGFMAFIEPSGVLHNHWTLTLHACIWHMMLVFLGLYLGLSRRTGKTIRDFICSTGVFICLALVAFIINISLFEVSGGSVNMFYVGPAISPLAVFKTIAGTFGWYVNTPLYLIAVTLGAFIIFLPFYLFSKKTKDKTGQK